MPKNTKEGKTMTNILKLKAAIMESGYNQEQLAKILGLTVSTLNYKINNKREFKAKEIKKLCEVLNISDIKTIFFAD